MNDKIEVLDVGSQPYASKNKRSNKPIIIMVLLVFSLLFFGLYKFTDVLNFTSKEQTSSENVPDLSLKDITVELGTKVSNLLTDYLENSPTDVSMYKLDIISIPMDNSITITAGTYEYSISCSTKSYTAKYVVKDTTPPKVYLKKLYKTIDEVSNLKVNDFVVKKSDSSNKIDVSFVDDTLAKILLSGTYSIKIKGTDQSDNETVSTTILTILNTPIVDKFHDNNASYNSIYDTAWNNVYVTKFDLATLKDSAIYTMAYENISAIDWLAVVKEKYPASIANDTIDIIDIYNQYDFIIGLAVRTSIKVDDVIKTIYLTK